MLAEHPTLNHELRPPGAAFVARSPAAYRRRTPFPLPSSPATEAPSSTASSRYATTPTPFETRGGGERSHFRYDAARPAIILIRNPSELVRTRIQIVRGVDDASPPE